MLTAIIPTFNNENSIKRVFNSASEVADDIIVVDSFSTDNTIEIARKCGALVIQREYQYSASQKNWALDKVKSEWVLILDSDEILSEDLRAEINLLKTKGIPDDTIAYRIPFIHLLWGKPISSITDRKVKLFKTELFRFEDKLVHAHPVTTSEGIIMDLDHPVYHFGIKNFDAWFHKMNRYTTWDCVERNKRKKATKWELIYKPPMYFLKVLLKEKIIFFGIRGYISAMMKTIMFIQLLLKHYELCYYSNDDFMKIKSDNPK